MSTALPYAKLSVKSNSPSLTRTLETFSFSTAKIRLNKLVLISNPVLVFVIALILNAPKNLIIALKSSSPANALMSSKLCGTLALSKPVSLSTSPKTAAIISLTLSCEKLSNERFAYSLEMYVRLSVSVKTIFLPAKLKSARVLSSPARSRLSLALTPPKSKVASTCFSLTELIKASTMPNVSLTSSYSPAGALTAYLLLILSKPSPKLMVAPPAVKSLSVTLLML